MFKILSSALVIAGLSYGWWWVDTHHPEVKHHILSYIDQRTLHTIETRYTAKQLMDRNKKSLLKGGHQFLEPSLKFSPYLLLEVKYTSPKQGTKEGILLWDMVDGEMVTDTAHWKKSHGLADCIRARIDKESFQVISAIAKKGGTSDRESLIKTLHKEPALVNQWIKTCEKKKLIVKAGKNYRLHLEKPHLDLLPETHLDKYLATKGDKRIERIASRFSPSQIKKMAEAIFGEHFAIRHTLTIYLPIHLITVQTSDGSVHTTYWNGLSGHKLAFSSLID